GVKLASTTGRAASAVIVRGFVGEGVVGFNATIGNTFSVALTRCVGVKVRVAAIALAGTAGAVAFARDAVRQLLKRTPCAPLLHKLAVLHEVAGFANADGHGVGRAAAARNLLIAAGVAVDPPLDA